MVFKEILWDFGVVEVVIDALKKTSLRNIELNPAFANSVVIRAPCDTHLRFYYFVQIGRVHIKYCAFRVLINKRL